MNWKLPLALLGLVLVLNMSAFAQGCTWCTSHVDACCDGHSSFDYTLPCATSTIYFQYNGVNDNEVEINLYNVTTGEVFLVQVVGDCDCARGELYNGATISAGDILRFKVNCRGCEGINCDAENLTIKFFTPSGNSCAPYCVGS